VSLSALTLRDPRRPFLIGIAAFVGWYLAAPSPGKLRGLAPYIGIPGRTSVRVALAACVCVLAFAIGHTSRAAGGSDSSCYVLQADAFARGHATLENPVARVLADVPNAVFAPIGFVPSRSEYGRAVPICAPGLALAMAGAYAVHPSAVFLVVPVCAALLVWLTFLYGRRVDGDVTGACAAVLVACSPIFLYQAVQPMSDVPAAAAWMAAFVLASRDDRAGALGAGLCASMAILIRPNLALLVLPLPALSRNELLPKKVAVTFFREKRWLSPFLVGAAPGIAILLALNAARYGSPLASGYGDTGALFAWTHVAANAPRYARWVIETHTPFVLLAAFAPFALRGDRVRARLAWISLLCVALLVATYLAYTVFDDWWYIRFLLPALPLVLALALVTARRVCALLPSAAGDVPIAVLTAVLALVYRDAAIARQVTDLQRLESRFALAGEYASRTLPPNAVVLAVQESGSIRFHGRRDTIAWDAIPPDGLDRAIRSLQERGRSVYFALEDTEESAFRRRFAGQRAGALDWPPLGSVRAVPQVRLYAPPLNRER
jgi:Dolichyl-phosphate-mannose-protein mannosyltransferase